MNNVVRGLTDKSGMSDQRQDRSAPPKHSLRMGMKHSMPPMPRADMSFEMVLRGYLV